MSYTHVNLVPDHDDQGHVVGFYVMVKDITQQKLAEREAENERMLLRNLLNLQERERQTVSHDIHDGIVQYIVGAQMQVEACEATLDPSDEATAAKLTLASEHLRAAVREGRRLISGLRPPIIDESGLVAAIEHLMGDLERQEGLRVDFDHVGVDRPLPAHLETAVFRIVQEALTNVARHSQAKYALVELEGTPDRIVADVCDNGRGFDRSAVPLDRFGLRGIEERARLFGGHAQIDSEPGQGTRIHVELPCEMHEPPPAPREEALPAAENLPI
jgi:signal transduction histidine kinase